MEKRGPKYISYYQARFFHGLFASKIIIWKTNCWQWDEDRVRSQICLWQRKRKNFICHGEKQIFPGKWFSLCPISKNLEINFRKSGIFKKILEKNRKSKAIPKFRVPLSDNYYMKHWREHTDAEKRKTRNVIFKCNSFTKITCYKIYKF